LETADARFEIGPLHQPFAVGIQQPAYALFHFGDRRTEAAGFLSCLGKRCAGRMLPALVFLAQTLGLAQQAADVLPNRFVQMLGSLHRILADASAAKARTVPTATAIVGVIVRGPTAGPFAIDRVAAAST